MAEYTVTIGYKAVINITVKANSKDEAAEKAVAIMSDQRDKMFKKQGVELLDDSFAAHGVLNMDETWNMVKL